MASTDTCTEQGTDTSSDLHTAGALEVGLDWHVREGNGSFSLLLSVQGVTRDSLFAAIRDGFRLQPLLSSERVLVTQGTTTKMYLRRFAHAEPTFDQVTLPDVAAVRELAASLVHRKYPDDSPKLHAVWAETPDQAAYVIGAFEHSGSDGSSAMAFLLRAVRVAQGEDAWPSEPLQDPGSMESVVPAKLLEDDRRLSGLWYRFLTRLLPGRAVADRSRMTTGAMKMMLSDIWSTSVRPPLDLRQEGFPLRTQHLVLEPRDTVRLLAFARANQTTITALVAAAHVRAAAAMAEEKQQMMKKRKKPSRWLVGVPANLRQYLQPAIDPGLVGAYIGMVEAVYDNGPLLTVAQKVKQTVSDKISNGVAYQSMHAARLFTGLGTSEQANKRAGAMIDQSPMAMYVSNLGRLPDQASVAQASLLNVAHAPMHVLTSIATIHDRTSVVISTVDVDGDRFTSLLLGELNSCGDSAAVSQDAGHGMDAVHPDSEPSRVAPAWTSGSGD